MQVKYKYTRRQGILRCEYIKLTMLHITKAGLTINLKLKRAKPRQANTQVSGTKSHSLPRYRNPTWNLILMHNGEHEKGDYMYMYKLHTPSFNGYFPRVNNTMKIVHQHQQATKALLKYNVQVFLQLCSEFVLTGILHICMHDFNQNKSLVKRIINIYVQFTSIIVLNLITYSMS